MKLPLDLGRAGATKYSQEGGLIRPHMASHMPPIHQSHSQQGEAAKHALSHGSSLQVQGIARFGRLRQKSVDKSLSVHTKSWHLTEPGHATGSTNLTKPLPPGTRAVGTVFPEKWAANLASQMQRPAQSLMWQEVLRKGARPSDRSRAYISAT